MTRKTITVRSGALALVVVIFVLAGPALADETANITVDPKTTYQAWEGWSCIPVPAGIPFEEWIADPTLEAYDRLKIKDLPRKLIASMHDQLVFDFGFTRLRLEVGPQVEIEKGAFRFLWQDHKIETHILPIKQRIESAGGKLVLYISYDLRSRLTKPFLSEPEGYAEMAEVFLRHLKQKYGLEPDYWSVMNEPGNHQPGNPKLCAEITAAVGKRLVNSGFKTRMSGPECVDIKQIPAYMEAMETTPGALDCFKQITYHLYWGGCDNIPARNAVRDWARKLGVTAAQTEWMEQADLNVARHIHLCLTEADVVAWDRYGTIGLFNLNYADSIKPESDDKKLEKSSTGWHVRQFSRYIRPGAVRIGTQSKAQCVRPVAFLSPNKKAVVVMLNTDGKPHTVAVLGLPEGNYEASCTSVPEKAFGKELPAIKIGNREPLNITLPRQSVCTVTADPPR
jgi:hypothetical protein